MPSLESVMQSVVQAYRQGDDAINELLSNPENKDMVKLWMKQHPHESSTSPMLKDLKNRVEPLTDNSSASGIFNQVLGAGSSNRLNSAEIESRILAGKFQELKEYFSKNPGELINHFELIQIHSELKTLNLNGEANILLPLFLDKLPAKKLLTILDDCTEIIVLVEPRLESKYNFIKNHVIKAVNTLPKKERSPETVEALCYFAEGNNLIAELEKIEKAERCDVICKTFPLAKRINNNTVRVYLLESVAKIPKQERGIAIAQVARLYENIWTLSSIDYERKSSSRDHRLRWAISELSSLLPYFPRETAQQSEEVIKAIVDLLKESPPDLRKILRELPANERREFCTQILPLVKEFCPSTDPDDFILGIAQLSKEKRNVIIPLMIGVLKQCNHRYVRNFMSVLVDSPPEKRDGIITSATPLLRIMKNREYEVSVFFSILPYEEYPLLARFLEQNPSLDLGEALSQFFAEFPETKERSYNLISKNLETVLQSSFHFYNASRLSTFLLKWQKELQLEDNHLLIKRAKRICTMIDTKIENGWQALNSLQLEILSSKLNKLILEDETPSDPKATELNAETAPRLEEKKVVPKTTSLIEEMFEAIKEYDFEKCFKLLENNPQIDVNQVDSEGYTLLHRVNEKSYPPDLLIALLIERGAEIDKRTPKGETALHMAASNLQPTENSVRKLLISGADPFATDEKGNTPLHIAMKKGSFKVAEILLQVYFNSPQGLTLKNNEGKSIFDKASANNFHYLIGKMTVDELSLAIDHGANLNTISYGEWSSLDAAILDGSVEKLRLLIKKGAKVNPDTERSPLDLALDLNRHEMMSILYQNGAKFRRVHCFNKNNHTPLMVMRYIIEPDEIQNYEDLLAQLQEADGGFTKRFIQLKFLAHRFGFNMSGIVLDGKNIPELEGFMYRIIKKEFLLSFKRVQEKENLFSDKTYQDISRAFERSSNNPDGLFASYERGEIVYLPLSIDTEKGPHFVGVILWNNYLIKCNRGAGSYLDNRSFHTGLQIYQINGKVSPETIQKLMSGDLEYFTSTVNKDLLLNKLPGGEQKRQKAGTCGWANIKSSLFGFLFASHIKEGMKHEKALAIAKQEYKAWSIEDRNHSLKELLLDLEPNEAFIQPLIHVLSKIAKKEHILDLLSSKESWKAQYGWNSPWVVELLLRMTLENISSNTSKLSKASNETTEGLISYIVNFCEEKQKSLLEKFDHSGTSD